MPRCCCSCCCCCQSVLRLIGPRLRQPPSFPPRPPVPPSVCHFVVIKNAVYKAQRSKSHCAIYRKKSPCPMNFDDCLPLSLSPSLSISVSFSLAFSCSVSTLGHIIGNCIDILLLSAFCLSHCQNATSRRHDICPISGAQRQSEAPLLHVLSRSIAPSLDGTR